MSDVLRIKVPGRQEATNGRQNPFKPTAGMTPPELIGREEVLDDFAGSIDDGVGAPARLMRVSGVRGVGKTALLNALGDVARNKGFNVIDVAAAPGFAARIARVAASPSPSVTVEPEAFGVKIGSVSVGGTEPDLQEALEAAAKRGGVFVTVDEIQDAPKDEMRQLGNTVQLLIREGANVAFAFAGLPSAVDEVVSGEGLTFLQRAYQVTLARLRDEDVLASMTETIRGSGMGVSDEVAKRLAKAAAGYPFMVQLVGYHCWRAADRRGSGEIGDADVDSGIRTARRHFDSMVIEPALKRLSDGQLEYLLAMASLDGPSMASGDVAQAMGRKTRNVSTVRARLIRAGIIEPAGYGKAAFTIPYMQDYLRKHDLAIREGLGAVEE